MQANMIAFGAAWQQGWIPLSSGAVDRALELNGAGLERNRSAFAWGRACVAAPAAVEEATRPVVAEPAPAPEWAAALAADAAGDRAELRRLLEIRITELAAFGGRRLARTYAETIATVRATEEERAPGATGVAEAVAVGLHKLMAYKDEYEVARLHLDAAERARIEAELGGVAATTYHLHPPFLRALGMKRKLRFGGWFKPGLRMLRAGRRAARHALRPVRSHRGPPDRAGARRASTSATWRPALAVLSPATHATCVELCETPDLVRGYEEIKLRGVKRFRARAAELLDGLEAPQPARPTGQDTPVPPSPQ